MTVQKMLNALPVLQRLMELKLPIKKAYSIYSLAKQINEQREFFIKEERKLIEKFNAEVLEDGRIKFIDSINQVHFAEEHNELMQYEVENFSPIELSFNDLGDAEMTPADLMTLEGVINFIE